MATTLEQAVQEIVTEILKTGEYFDSHTVINELIQNKDYHLLYLNGWKNGSYSDVKDYHKHIAEIIRDKTPVKSVADDFVSHTIYGNLSPNKIWQRI